MPYQLEKITPENQKRIFQNADDIKRSHLLMRGGYFTEDVDINWALDSENDSYLLSAPKFESKSCYAYFYFYFHSKIYGFRIHRDKSTPIVFDDPTPEDAYIEFKQALESAFSVHRFCGLPDQEPPFNPIFSKEGT